MKKGLVLEGGAMRGIFTAGILDVFLENKIDFDGAVGASAGAVFGCNYKSVQPGRSLRYNIRFCKDKRYCGFHSLISSGNLYNAEFCYHELPAKLDIFDIQTFKDNPFEFHVVCTDVLTGQAVYKELTEVTYDALEWLRASASMPMVSKIVNVDSYFLLDGGIADSIPVKYFENLGYGKNVVILTRPDGYQKKRNKLLPLLKIWYSKYPAFIQALKTRHEMYNETLAYIAEREKEGKLFVIRPEQALKIGKMERNPDKIRNVYNIGRQTGEKHLAAVKKFLNQA